MTKTHTGDNQLIDQVRALINGMKHKAIAPGTINGIKIEDVLASKSLFELADLSHLGRSRTRTLLGQLRGKLIDQSTKAEVAK